MMSWQLKILFTQNVLYENGYYFPSPFQNLKITYLLYMLPYGLFEESWMHQCCFKHHKILGTTADSVCLLSFLVTIKSYSGWKKNPQPVLTFTVIVAFCDHVIAVGCFTTGMHSELLHCCQVIAIFKHHNWLPASRINGEYGSQIASYGHMLSHLMIAVIHFTMETEGRLLVWLSKVIFHLVTIALNDRVAGPSGGWWWVSKDYQYWNVSLFFKTTLKDPLDIPRTFLSFVRKIQNLFVLMTTTVITCYSSLHNQASISLIVGNYVKIYRW